MAESPNCARVLSVHAGAEWSSSLDLCGARLRSAAGGCTVVEAPVTRKVVRLVWTDAKGRVERVLQVSKLCPQCQTRHRRRPDTHGLATSNEYAPMECTRCLPGTYYAIPLASADELRDVAEYRRASQFPELVERSWWSRLRATARAALTEWRSP